MRVGAADTTKTGVHADTEALARFAQERGIAFVVLYGSHATGSPNDESDVDVAVYFKRGKESFGSFREYSDVLERLAEFLHVSEDKLDLVVLNRANILLRYEITSKGKLLYGNEDAYAQYRAFAFRDYVDAKPLFALEELLLKKRQALIREAATAL